MRELNLDGLVGPSHNYAGLSLGNLAATSNAGATSAPRRAALQSLGKMRRLVSLGVPQGLLLPHRRPNAAWLRGFGFTGNDATVLATAAREDPPLFAAATSASAMWTANAATVCPAPDSGDGRTHFTPANLATMPHRAQEAAFTHAQLRLAFADRQHFAVHAPIPPCFGDEGAANHMRLAATHADPATQVFVYGEAGGAFPARQHVRASQAVARQHGTRDALFARQADIAIQSGAFHNDVVAVANESVLFAHETAFHDRNGLVAALQARVPGFTLVEAPAADVPLADAIASYVFNAALVSLPDGMALFLPAEARETPSVWAWLQRVVADPANPITHLHILDLRESMRNGGGPACLRLRVALSDAALAAVDPRFLVDDARLDALERLVETHWPQAINPSDLGNPSLWADTAAAHAALLDQLQIPADALRC
ncbi:N-succinylarginine dihydrolase [Sandaracinobacteroides saxicola]|uniref:N-succinylarginine dihydrolase n=1 Tax=Sandaracinobacteroides saxicola TaxID=2759707 RepID=A0A7G5IJK6_9SPHN|nr:N-succinylarginine dihydrolase [Sandaracinobacteroides saxicola]QMW23548.1 N-succinylarginine dihydrolase [Sandaracinobacteroides saxicola]